MDFAQKAQKFAAAITGLSLWLAAPCAASGLEVSPITVQLPAKGGAGALYLANRGQDPVAVQIEALAWRQTPAGEELAPSDTIAVSPPLARLAPGQKQTVRLLVASDATAANERAFRVIVSELPPPTKSDAIRMLLQFSIPVFASDASSKANVAWAAEHRADGLWIAAHNTGSKRAKFSELEFAAAGSVQPSAKLAYILAGATRAFKVTGIGPAQAIDIRARDPASNKLTTLTSVPLGR